MSEAEIMALAGRGLIVLEEATADIWPLLSSELAQRVYVVLSFFVLLGVAIQAARKEMHQLTKMAAEDFHKKKPGPDPEKSSSIEKRINDMLNFQTRVWRRLLSSAGLALLLGIALPSVVLFLAAQNYCWFSKGQPFVGISCPFPPEGIHAAEAGIFVLNQLFHGVLFDLFEIFEIELGSLRSNPSEIAFSIGILLYRIVVGPFAFVLAVFLARSLIIQWKLRKRLFEWHEKHRIALIRERGIATVDGVHPASG